tara:strand:+ start:230 stop:721 length:492 start_codon:yes stop_codon:yes gene_type:complete
MIIKLKNKDKLIVGDFFLNCAIGKMGLTKNKVEGDLKTPKGIFSIDKLYYRKDRIKSVRTKLQKIEIKKNFVWCNDVDSKYYNKRTKISKNYKFEKLFRQDKKYDMLIPIKYNWNKITKGKGSAIFLHLIGNYKTTAGCIALSKKDFLVMLNLIDKNTKIKIS